MLSDTMSDAVNEIEEWEKLFPQIYSNLSEKISRLKGEMLLVQLYFDLSPSIFECYAPADYEWLRTESLNRARTRAPHQFSEVFYECLAELRVQKFGK
jgi:hypothetical protein